MADRLYSIGSLEKYQFELETTIGGQEEKLGISKDELDGINQDKKQAPMEFDEISENIELSKKELIGLRLRVKNLQDTKRRTADSINKLLNDGHNFASDVAVNVANEFTINDRELREKAVEDVLDTD
jgi:predicted  nucleic acid-binding Zn-ribbon protein